jgi:hypothetical protein
MTLGTAEQARFVTGHDFSRATNAAKSTRALAPEVFLLQIEQEFRHSTNRPPNEEAQPPVANGRY